MRLFLIVNFTLFATSCNQNINESDERARLMELHHQMKEDHLSKNAKVMVEVFADNFVSVNRGKIDSLTSREAHELRFQKYFDAVKFKKWDDVSPPIIRFSDDHSIAYMTVDKLVVTESKDSAGNLVEESTHFAWVSIFHKQADGDWKLECVASTNEPVNVKPL